MTLYVPILYNKKDKFLIFSTRNKIHILNTFPPVGRHNSPWVVMIQITNDFSCISNVIIAKKY